MKRLAASAWRQALQTSNHPALPQVARWLIHLLDHDPSSQIRRAAAYYANDRSDHRGLPGTLLRRALDPQEHPLVRGQSLEALAWAASWHRPCTRGNRKVHQAVLRCLVDSHPNIRFWACYAAAILRLQRAAHPLRQLTGDPELSDMDWTVGYEATQALRALRGEDAWTDDPPAQWNALGLEETLN